VGDILYAVRDPLTVPISRKITLNNLLIAINSLYVGWVPVTDAWAYARAYTITVPSGAASLYNKGDKVRFKQGAGYKYYYIITVADTLLTVTGGSDYTVANAAITDVYYSKIVNPLDFPTGFNCTLVHTGFSSDPTYTSRFSITGRLVHWSYNYSGAGISDSTAFTISLPIPTPGIISANHGWAAALGITYDAGAYAATGSIVVPAVGTEATLYRTQTTAAWTNSSGKAASFEIFYEI